MHQETASLMSLGEVDEELEEKIRVDIERIVIDYLLRNMSEISYSVVTSQQSTIERFALRALKNHLNTASNIY